MSNPSPKFPKSNPFSTCYTAPGKTPYFFEAAYMRQLKSAHPAKFEEYFTRNLGLGEDQLRHKVGVNFLVDKFESHSCRGQIVGNHGSGKTTLLYSLRTVFLERGYEIFSWELHDQQSFLPDVFWFELQKFLRAAPNFLPTQCLLPPPVVSQKDYIEQRRAVAREFMPDDAEPDAEEQEEKLEFRVPDRPEEASAEPAAAEEPEKADESERNGAAEQDGEPLEVEGAEDSERPETEAAPKIETPLMTLLRTPAVENFREFSEGRKSRNKGVLGFNEVGNFGLTNGKRDGVRSDLENTRFGEEQSSVPFAPFPGIAPGVDEPAESGETGDDEEEYDDVRVEPASNFPALRTQRDRRLAIPTLEGLDIEKRRSFFEKKVVFFDGFEQLSYVNRIILRTFCRMNRLGLLITSHTPAIG
ncbi:MAG: hypothetical protein IIU43_09620, partial [Thermoguttaceae bacterium]|nr:hypothetical protein [Thermoguttaceae bacterium]